MAPDHRIESSETGRVGPHPSYIEIARPYIFEAKLQECLTGAGVSEAKDDNFRLQGVAWIDNVRKFMHLPVRTYNTAAVHYHKFRLDHPETTGYIDVAAAALFASCKIEDTLKKSKEILCAAYNLKLSPAEQLTPDDPLFEQHSKTIIILERLMLEASGFDFRNRQPQRLVLKTAKHYNVDQETVGRTAYNISLDLYRTYTPLKQSTPTMAMACVELAGRVCEQRIQELELGMGYQNWSITRSEVMETLLDLLDLYTHHRTSTMVGQEHALEKFINIRITLNQEASSHNYPRFAPMILQKNKNNNKRPPHTTNGSKIANGTNNHSRNNKNRSPEARRKASPTSPDGSEMNDVLMTSPVISNGSTGLASKPGMREGTVRFMLSAERARDEKNWVKGYFKVVEEEYEIEVPVVERERRRG